MTDLNIMHFAQLIPLGDASMLRLRELRTDDRERLRAFFARCSEEALRYRFMSSIKAPSDSLLNYLTDIDGYRPSQSLRLSLYALFGNAKRLRRSQC